MNLKYGVIDLETTGLDPKSGEILQIALLSVIRNKDELIQTNYYHTKLSLAECESAYKINHMQPENITHLRNTIVLVDKREVPKYFKEDLYHWQQTLNQYDVLIGHNVKFDISFLLHAGLNLSHHKIIDTAKLMQQLYPLPHPKRWSLKKSCSQVGIVYDADKAHDAMYDVNLTENLFHACSAMLTIKQFQENVE